MWECFLGLHDTGQQNLRPVARHRFLVGHWVPKRMPLNEGTYGWSLNHLARRTMQEAGNLTLGKVPCPGADVTSDTRIQWASGVFLIVPQAY